MADNYGAFFFFHFWQNLRWLRQLPSRLWYDAMADMVTLISVQHTLLYDKVLRSVRTENWTLETDLSRQSLLQNLCRIWCWVYWTVPTAHSRNVFDSKFTAPDRSCNIIFLWRALQPCYEELNIDIAPNSTSKNWALHNLNASFV
jgi:hypothetical protein